MIACAFAARAQVIVSGDKDLRSLGTIGALRVVSPAEALGLAG